MPKPKPIFEQIYSHDLLLRYAVPCSSHDSISEPRQSVKPDGTSSHFGLIEQYHCHYDYHWRFLGRLHLPNWLRLAITSAHHCQFLASFNTVVAQRPSIRLVRRFGPNFAWHGYFEGKRRNFGARQRRRNSCLSFFVKAATCSVVLWKVEILSSLLTPLDFHRGHYSLAKFRQFANFANSDTSNFYLTLASAHAFADYSSRSANWEMFAK